MKTQAMHDKLNYPLRAWTIWLLSAIFMFYKYALEVSPSVMTSTLMTAFDISGVSLGNLAACYFYAYLLLQIPAGLLLDRFGPRKTTTLAIALCAAGNLIFAGADSVCFGWDRTFFNRSRSCLCSCQLLKTDCQLVPL